MLLAGCQGEVSGPTSTAPPSAESLAAGPVAPTAVPTPDYVLEEDDPDPNPMTSPTPDIDSGARAVQTATATLTAFARPTLDDDQWWAELAPFLSDAARTAYEGTDPANVPVTAVTGPGELGPWESGYLAKVTVPTDVGTYQVLLSRAGQYTPWTVEQITPPEGLN
jgi:hypothetical protein